MPPPHPATTAHTRATSTTRLDGRTYAVFPRRQTLKLAEGSAWPPQFAMIVIRTRVLWQRTCPLNPSTLGVPNFLHGKRVFLH